MPEGTCSADGCERSVFTRRRCQMHYTRWLRDLGVPRSVLMGSVAERLWSNFVRDPSGCWLWTGTIAGNGYGNVKIDKRSQGAHRAMYELIVGPIPEGLHLDHLCRVRHCVNPSHLEPVTCRENLLRSPLTFAGINARKTTCDAGHPLVPRPGRQQRWCPTCS